MQLTPDDTGACRCCKGPATPQGGRRQPAYQFRPKDSLKVRIGAHSV